jgi:hypothetical protein
MRARLLFLVVIVAATLAVTAPDATVSAFSAVTANPSSSFASAASFCPATQPAATFLSGFEDGVVTSAGTGMYENIFTGGGSPAIDAGVKRYGSYSLLINKTGAGINYVRKIPTGTNGIVVARFAFRLASLPSANVGALFTVAPNAGNAVRIKYDLATQKLKMTLGSASVLAGSTISATTWYVIDVRTDVAANPRTVDWQIDGVAQGSASSSETGSTVSGVRLGGDVSGDVYTANYDDFLMSETATDYPIGDGKVLAVAPNGLSTHSSVGSFANHDGTAIGASTPGYVADRPLTSTTDYIKQTATGSGSYVGLTMADTADACVDAVRGVVAYNASGTNATAAATRFLDGASTTTFSHTGSSTLTYAAGMLTPATTWSATTLNGLIVRTGFATSVTSMPYWQSILAEYNVPL